jgi:hypothetical protein
LFETFDILDERLSQRRYLCIRYAPIAAFSAMAFTVGAFGLSSLGSLAELVLTTYVAMAFFIFVVLGVVARIFGFNILKFLSYIREEIVIMLSTSNSESVLPRLMEKMQRLGCARSVVALVLPTGYTLNLRRHLHLSLTVYTLHRAGLRNTPYNHTAGGTDRHYDGHVQGSWRRIWCWICDFGFDVGRDRNVACGGPGASAWGRTLHVDGPWNGEHDRQRCGHRGCLKVRRGAR